MCFVEVVTISYNFLAGLEIVLYPGKPLLDNLFFYGVHFVRQKRRHAKTKHEAIYSCVHPERDSVSALERSSKWPFAFLIVLHTIAERLHGRLGRKHRTLHTQGQKANSVG